MIIEDCKKGWARTNPLGTKQTYIYVCGFLACRCPASLHSIRHARSCCCRNCGNLCPAQFVSFSTEKHCFPSTRENWWLLTLLPHVFRVRIYDSKKQEPLHGLDLHQPIVWLAATLAQANLLFPNFISYFFFFHSVALFVFFFQRVRLLYKIIET